MDTVKCPVCERWLLPSQKCGFCLMQGTLSQSQAGRAEEIALGELGEYFPHDHKQYAIGPNPDGDPLSDCEVCWLASK